MLRKPNLQQPTAPEQPCSTQIHHDVSSEESIDYLCNSDQIPFSTLPPQSDIFRDPVVFRSMKIEPMFGEDETVADDIVFSSKNPDLNVSLPSLMMDSKQSRLGVNQGDLSITLNSKVVTDALQTFEGQPPLAPGGYLEPSYHFFTRSKPSEFLERLLSVLIAIQIDCQQLFGKFKLKCVGYSGGQRLPFIVSVFSTVEQGRSAIEFQRRSGCILQFSCLYNAIKQKLEAWGLIDGSEVCKSVWSFSNKPPVIDESELSDDEAVQSINCLMQMASSDFIDVKASAVLAVSELSVEPAVQEALLKWGISPLVDWLTCRNEDVHRCAATIIANLANGKRADFCKAFCNSALSRLASLTTSETLQVVRESARALANVASTLSREMHDCKEWSSVLRNLASCEDPRIRWFATQIQTSFGLPDQDLQVSNLSKLDLKPLVSALDS